jgi:hypothetical protein
MPSSVNPVWIPMPERIVALAHVATGHTCAQLASGRLRCWGANRAGELGIPALVSSTSPVRVAR